MTCALPVCNAMRCILAMQEALGRHSAPLLITLDTETNSLVGALFKLAKATANKHLECLHPSLQTHPTPCQASLTSPGFQIGALLQRQGCMQVLKASCKCCSSWLQCGGDEAAGRCMQKSLQMRVRCMQQVHLPMSRSPATSHRAGTPQYDSISTAYRCRAWL